LHAKVRNDDELRYQRALVDPFNPGAIGCRIPTKLPQDVVTYGDYQEYDTTADGFAVFANFALHGRYSAFILNDASLASQLKTATPQSTSGTATYVRDSTTQV